MDGLAYTISFPNGVTKHVNRLDAVFLLAHRFIEKYGSSASEDMSTTSAKGILAAVDKIPPAQAHEYFTEAEGLRIVRYTAPA